MRFPDFKNESKALKAGYRFVLGCDEAGRGPLAGPVVAAACMLDPKSIGGHRSKNKWYYRVRDSKTVSETERDGLAKEILENALCYGVGVVWQEDIDRLNIHRASLEAMRLAVENLISNLPACRTGREPSPSNLILFLDGRHTVPGLAIEQKSVVAGDSKILSISAASIIAKVHRDGIMREFDAKFPEYGFARHKGYGTKAHKDTIKKLGITPLHRKSFLKGAN